MSSIAFVRIAILAATIPTLPSLPALPRHHPHDIIDCVQLSPQYGHDRTLFATSEGTINLVVRSRDGGTTWSDVRSGITGRHVFSMALADDFQTSGLAWAALGENGLIRSEDGGSSWTVTPFRADSRLLALGPPVPQAPGPIGKQPTLFVGTNKGLFRVLADGSTARPLGADTFQRKNIPQRMVVANDGTLFVYSADGTLWRSRDDGEVFTRLCRPGDVRAIVPSPTYMKDQTLFVATFGAGILVSRNRGATFEPMNRGLDDLMVNDLAIPKRWPDCQEMFAVTKDAGLFRSVDGGRNWQLTPFAVIEKTYQTTNHHLHVRLPADYPQTPDVVVGTYEGLFVSKDRGATFLKSNINPTRIGRRLAISPDFADDATVFTSGYGMLLSISNDAGKSWDFSARDVNALSTYALAVAPTWRTEGLIVLGVNEGVWSSRNRGASWNLVRLDPFARPDGPRQDHDIFQFAFSPAFATDRTCFGVSFGGVYVSNDAAASFETRAPPSRWLKALAVSPNFAEDKTFFVGGEMIHRSVDGGLTFEGPLLTGSIDGMLCAQDFKTSRLAFAVSRKDGVFRSSDGGDSWKPANDGLNGHRPTTIQGTVDSDGKYVLFVGTLGGGIHRSRDRGLTWERFGRKDPHLQNVLSLAFSPKYREDGTFFAGALDGVWRSTDRGQTFALTTQREIYDNMREPWQHSSGKWERYGREGAHQGMADMARRAGATMTLPFVGSKVELLTTRGPDHGMAEVLLDGVVVSEFDGYSAQPEGAVPIFASAELRFGAHVLAVRVLGKKREASSDVLVGVDAAIVWCTDPALLRP